MAFRTRAQNAKGPGSLIPRCARRRGQIAESHTVVGAPVAPRSGQRTDSLDYHSVSRAANVRLSEHLSLSLSLAAALSVIACEIGGRGAIVIARRYRPRRFAVSSINHLRPTLAEYTRRLLSRALASPEHRPALSMTRLTAAVQIPRVCATRSPRAPSSLQITVANVNRLCKQRSGI